MLRKKFLRNAAALTVGCLMSFSFFACGTEENPDPATNVYNDSKHIALLSFEEPVSLVSPSVTAYLNAEPDESVSGFLYGSSAKNRMDKGLPVDIEYVFDNPTGFEIAEEKIEVSKTRDFSSVEQTVYAQSRRNDPISLYNLYTNAQYYYRVTVTLENGDVHKKIGQFETAASPRFINLDGACNVRDIGGWTTESGKTVKQGLLYRGSEIDGGKNTGHVDFCLTEKGVEQLRALGIKTDFDLREESCKVGEYSILGEDVSRNFYNAPQYQSALNESNAETVRKLFSDLANPEAYPAYIHCTHGVDRAGTASLLLESLLGVAKEDLVRDYELSAFYYNYAHVNRSLENGGNVLKLLERLEKYEGETLADKAATFLLSVGVTQAEIDSIRNIFLG